MHVKVRSKYKIQCLQMKLCSVDKKGSCERAAALSTTLEVPSTGFNELVVLNEPGGCPKEESWLIVIESPHL